MYDHNLPDKPVYALPDATAKTQEQWRSYCADLLAEMELLLRDNDDLREQRGALAQMVPIPEDVQKLAEMTLEELMADCEGQPSLAEIISEIQAGRGH